jgi:hypothetical protein
MLDIIKLLDRLEAAITSGDSIATTECLDLLREEEAERRSDAEYDAFEHDLLENRKCGDEDHGMMVDE